MKLSTDKVALDFYHQDLEIDIISRIAELKDIGLMEATDVFYRSHLAKQINARMYDIDNLSAKYLADDLIENEPELFSNTSHR